MQRDDGDELTSPALLLRPDIDSKTLKEALPKVVRIGDGYSKVVHVGRSSENHIVLPLVEISRQHCDIMLRKFTLQGQSQVHEALFLRDTSFHGTFVNGVAAQRPWHWLQMDDKIGVYLDNSLVVIYQVQYPKSAFKKRRIRGEQSPLSGNAPGFNRTIAPIGRICGFRFSVDRKEISKMENPFVLSANRFII